MTLPDGDTTEPVVSAQPSSTRNMTGRARAVAGRHWPLIIILVFSSVVGFWGLPQRGSLFIDEGYQQLESTWVQAKIHYIDHHLDAKQVDLRRFLTEDGQGVPLAYGKPMHSLLGALALAAVPGRGPTPILVVECLLGLATIALVYSIAHRLGGRAAAVGAAAVLGASAYWLAYRRSGLPEADSVFFFTLALWALVVWAGRGPVTVRRTFIVGAITGLCFTTNDRWYIAAPLMAVFVFLLDGREEELGPRVRRGAVQLLSLAAGFFVPLALFEAVYAGFLFAAHEIGIVLPYKTYLQQIYGRYKLVTVAHHAGPRIGQIVHSPYPQYLHAMEGIVWLLVMIAALILIAARWKREHAVALLFALGPVLLASSSVVAAPRYMSLSVPGIALAAGFAFAWAAAHVNRLVRAGGIVFLALALSSSLSATPQVLSLRASWGPALGVVRARGGAVISPKGYSLATYLGKSSVRLGWQESIAWARAQVQAGARFAVLELFVPPGAPASDPSAASVIGPAGELSRFLISREKPLVSERFRTQRFIYEGLPPNKDRLILVYDLSVLPASSPGT